MLGKPVSNYESNTGVSRMKFKRVGFDGEGSMYYRLSSSKYVKYNKEVVELLDLVPIEFVKVKDLVKQVTPSLKVKFESTLLDVTTKYFRAETDEENLMLVVWLLSCFFVNSQERPLLILEGGFSKVLSHMIRKIILPIDYADPLVINNGGNETNNECYMLTTYVTRKMMNDKNLLSKALHIRVEDSSDLDTEEFLHSFEKELPILLSQIFNTVKCCLSLIFESNSTNYNSHSFTEIGEVYFLLLSLECSNRGITYEFKELYDLCKYTGIDLINDNNLTVEI